MHYQVGAVIMTKMDGHAKGGGALGAVAATKSPITFIGTGEHMHEFEKFDAKSFVGRIMGKGDWRSFVDKIQVDQLNDAKAFTTCKRRCFGNLWWDKLQACEQKKKSE